MKSLLKKLDIKVIILSRGRYDTITSHELLPNYIEVLVPESERELYEKAISNPILTTPDDIKGLGKLRNWVLNNFDEETIIMVDDDMKAVYNITQEMAIKITDVEKILWILINTAVMAKDAKCGVFGFQQRDIRQYNNFEPFELKSWVGGIIGVIGRKIDFIELKAKVDIDFCLKNLLVNRIIFRNNMYMFSQERDTNKGGNSGNKSKAEIEEEMNVLKSIWGQYIKFGKTGSQFKSVIKVRRKQKI